MITHRFFQRLNWVLLALAVGFAVTGHGDLLFYLILTTPVLLLVMVAYNRVARGVGARPERVIGPDSPAPTGSILWAAVGGVVLIVVLMVAAPLIIYGHEDGNVLMLVAGFGLVSVFAGLALSPHLLRIGWFVTMRGLATFGRRREFYHGMLELASGRLSKAEHSFRRHLNRYPEDGCARTSLAVALLAQARREEALAEADLAADSDRRPEALYCHGSILAAIGDTAGGAAEMEAALATKPRLPGGRLYFAMALIELRRLEAAIAVLATERSVWKSSLYYTVLGEANRLLGRADLAADAYVTAEQKASTEAACGSGSSLAVGAYSLAAQGKLDDALAVTSDVLRDDGANVLALCAKNLIDRRRGDNDAVAANMERIVILAPTGAVSALADPLFTPLLTEKRFREFLAWALGAQRQARERALARPNPPG